MKIAEYVGVSVVIYAIIWTVIYAIFMSFDFRYFAVYFLLSWTGPGEIPAYIQILSITITFLIMHGIVFWKLMTSKYRRIKAAKFD